MCKRLSQTATHGDIAWTLYFVAAFLRQQDDLDGIVGREDSKDGFNIYGKLKVSVR